MSGVFGRRACAALALTSAGLHAAMLGHASNVVAAALAVLSYRTRGHAQLVSGKPAR